MDSDAQTCLMRNFHRDLQLWIEIQLLSAQIVGRAAGGEDMASSLDYYSHTRNVHELTEKLAANSPRPGFFADDAKGSD